MAQSDFLSRHAVLEKLHQLFTRYGISYMPEGDVHNNGFCAAVPKAIEEMPPAYDIEAVVEDIKLGQSLNIPHQGYCINKDLVVQMVRDGETKSPVPQEDINTVSDDLDKAIAFVTLKSFCETACTGGDCTCCDRYISKKTTLRSLNFYRKIEEMRMKIQYMEEHCESFEQRRCYEAVEKMFEEAIDYANDKTNLC